MSCQGVNDIFRAFWRPLCDMVRPVPVYIIGQNALHNFYDLPLAMAENLVYSVAR